LIIFDLGFIRGEGLSFLGDENREGEVSMSRIDAERQHREGEREENCEYGQNI